MKIDNETSQPNRVSRRGSATIKTLIGLALIACVIGVALRAQGQERAPEPQAKPGSYRLTFENQGLERAAVVYVPTGYQESSQPPLVIALHGAGGSGEHAVTNDHWKETADDKGFLLVAPDGVPARTNAEANFLSNPRLWNSGQLRPRSPRGRIDDVAYIKQLLDEVEKRIPFDRKRVYVVGHSNGAGMSFRLANEMPDQITAIAAMAGEVVPNPNPSRAVPTLAIFGVEDDVRPLNGGESELPWGTRTTRPVKDELREWALALGCSGEAELLNDEDGVRKEIYRSSNSGGELTAIYLEGHGHAWPQSTRGAVRRRVVGPTHPTFKANDVIWEFFLSQPELAESPTR